MKKRRYLVHAGLACLALGTARPSPAADAAKTVPQGTTKAPSPASVDLSSLDRKVAPCADFYQFACGNWIKQTEVPADESSWSRGFATVAKRNREVLRTALEDFAQDKKATNSEHRKLGDYYATCMDPHQADASARVLKRRLATLKAIKSRQELAVQVARLHLEGVDVLFGFGPSPDLKNSDQMIGEADQGGMGLPDRDYYLDKKGTNPKIRKDYEAHIAKMLELAGEPKATARQDARDVLKIETRLAKAAMPREQRRQPLNVYHRLDRVGLIKIAPDFAWQDYFATLGLPKVQAINVADPGFIKAMNATLKTVPLAQLKAYLYWHLLDRAAPTLADTFVQEDFRFASQAFTGQKEIKPRWKRCVAATGNALGDPLAHAFVDRTFGGDAKAYSQEMIKTIEAAMAADLTSVSWMDQPTRAQAEVKLSHIENQVGYTDKWRDFDGLRVARHSYLDNALTASVFNSLYELNKIGRPVDRKEWGMEPYVVNAYYSPADNKIVFPAGILQPPFFSKDAPLAANYGAIGMVMGHELTHGFDDEGRQFDAKGNLRDWWTKPVAKEFDARTACLVKQYGSYVPVDSLHLNGKLTLGENIADLGGMHLAYVALHQAEKQPAFAQKVHGNVAGFTPDQQFFLSYAQEWCAKRRPEIERMLLRVDPHSPPRYRVNGVLQNTPAFADAFQCKQGTAMAPVETCKVW